MKTFTLVILFLSYVLPSVSQSFNLLKSISIEEPSEVSIDQAGNIYVATFEGDITKFDPLLNDRLIFSPSNPNTTTILEAWQGYRVFSFHKDLQIFRLINRNLSLNEDYSFPGDLIGFAEIATSTYDNNVWVIDLMDFNLKKYELFSNSISSVTSLNQLLDVNNYAILFCKEYQNRLFVSTLDQGILIFDNFGNYIKTYENKGISFFSFWKDNLYFLENGSLLTLSLYNGESSIRTLPGNEDWKFVLVYDNLVYLFSETKVSVFN